MPRNDTYQSFSNYKKLISSTYNPHAMDAVTLALDALRKGDIILLYDADGREEETDFVMASQFVKPKDIAQMRRDGGGLICTTVDPVCREKLALPYLTELYQEAENEYPIVKRLVPNDIPYDEKSAFTLTINHRKTFTGISDNDRALTISEFAALCGSARTMSGEEVQREFGKNFRSPGHIHLLNASNGLLDARKGHTELSTAMMSMAGLVPSATICEMVGNNGHSTPKNDSLTYAEERELVFIEGKDVVEVWVARNEGR
jgi:3,4-dihydroxy 2-butanone 4-phosphate synthase